MGEVVLKSEDVSSLIMCIMSLNFVMLYELYSELQSDFLPTSCILPT